MKPDVHVRIGTIIIHSLDVGNRAAFSRGVVDAIESHLAEPGGASMQGPDAPTIPDRIGAAVGQAVRNSRAVGSLDRFSDR